MTASSSPRVIPCFVPQGIPHWSKWHSSNVHNATPWAQNHTSTKTQKNTASITHECAQKPAHTQVTGLQAMLPLYSCTLSAYCSFLLTSLQTAP